MLVNVTVTPTCFDGQAIIVRGHQRLQVHYASTVMKYFIDAVDCRSDIRRGHYSVGFVGVLQPFRYAVRLFSSEQYFPVVSNYLVYCFLLFLLYFLLC
jgi:NADH:ubiquinone oxidoreductase subunit H